jgi:FMN phosphatase YigB (HAD superfamily)
MKHKRLVCFDFDDTLFHTPKPEEGKPVFLEKTGNVWPHRGWWGKSDTIDIDIFDIPLNEWVHDKFLHFSDNSENFVMLATGRLKKVEGMRENIDKIFEKNDIEFDEVHLNWGGDTLHFKIKLFEQKIEELGVEEFIMFDDRELHLIEFKEWAKSINCKISIVDVINKTTDKFNY